MQSELQIVNDLEEIYRLRYKSEYASSSGHFPLVRYVADRLGNSFVTLKVSSNINPVEGHSLIAVRTSEQHSVPCTISQFLDFQQHP